MQRTHLTLSLICNPADLDASSAVIVKGNDQYLGVVAVTGVNSEDVSSMKLACLDRSSAVTKFHKLLIGNTIEVVNNTYVGKSGFVFGVQSVICNFIQDNIIQPLDITL